MWLCSKEPISIHGPGSYEMEASTNPNTKEKTQFLRAQPSPRDPSCTASSGHFGDAQILKRPSGFCYSLHRSLARATRVRCRGGMISLPPHFSFGSWKLVAPVLGIDCTKCTNLHLTLVSLALLLVLEGRFSDVLGLEHPFKFEKELTEAKINRI